MDYKHTSGPFLGFAIVDNLTREIHGSSDGGFFWRKINDGFVKFPVTEMVSKEAWYQQYWVNEQKEKGTFPPRGRIVGKESISGKNRVVRCVDNPTAYNDNEYYYISRVKKGDGGEVKTIYIPLMYGEYKGKSCRDTLTSLSKVPMGKRYVDKRLRNIWQTKKGAQYYVSLGKKVYLSDGKKFEDLPLKKPEEFPKRSPSPERPHKRSPSPERAPKREAKKMEEKHLSSFVSDDLFSDDEKLILEDEKLHPDDGKDKVSLGDFIVNGHKRHVWMFNGKYYYVKRDENTKSGMRKVSLVKEPTVRRKKSLDGSPFLMTRKISGKDRRMYCDEDKRKQFYRKYKNGKMRVVHSPEPC